MKENKEIKNLLLASYPVPFIGDDYRINVYQYGEDDVKDVLCSKYCGDLLMSGQLQDTQCFT